MKSAPAAVVSRARRETSALMETAERDEARLVTGAEKEAGARAARESIVSGLCTKRECNEVSARTTAWGGRAGGRSQHSLLVPCAGAVCTRCDVRWP